MIATTIVSILTFLTLTLSILFFPSVKIGRRKLGSYWVIALLGAAILLCLGQTPLSVIWAGLTQDTEVNPLKILVLFFSMTFLSVFLDEAGFFRLLANRATRAAGTDQRRLFILLYLLTALLTVFTSNDIIILTLTPFICFFCKNAKISPLPYLVSEFAVANTWSMMLVIGNPTNIYLATSAGIGFLDYIKVMALPTVAAGVVEFLLLLLLFRKQLGERMEPESDDFKIESKADLAVGVAHLAVCLVFLVISGYLRLPMWLISAVCALSLLLFATLLRLTRKGGPSHVKTATARLPWQLIPFVLSMFVIVICLGDRGISHAFGKFLGDRACVWTYGASSFFFANLINNIPMSILFSTLPAGLAAGQYQQAIYASIAGSNIGAFLTPIGALAGIMFTELTDRYQVDYGFRRFLKYGAIISIPTFAATLALLALILK